MQPTQTSRQRVAPWSCCALTVFLTRCCRPSSRANASWAGSEQRGGRIDDECGVHAAVRRYASRRNTHKTRLTPAVTCAPRLRVALATHAQSASRRRRLGECRHLCENAPRRFEDEKTVRWKSNSYTNTCTIMFSLAKCQVQRMRLSSATAHRIACERGVTGLQTGTRAHLRHAETSA